MNDGLKVAIQRDCRCGAVTSRVPLMLRMERRVGLMMITVIPAQIVMMTFAVVVMMEVSINRVGKPKPLNP